MQRQTFSLVNDFWRARHRREKRLRAGFLATGVLWAVGSIALIVLRPSEYLLGLVFSGGAITFALIPRVFGRYEPAYLAIGESDVELGYLGETRFKLDLNTPKAAVWLTDQSVVVEGKTRGGLPFPPFVVWFVGQIQPFAITAEAFAALQVELPRLGLALASTTGKPSTQGGQRWVYRRVSAGASAPLH